MAELARVCEYDEGSTNGMVDEELKAEQVENRKHKHRFLKYTITAGIKIASRPVSYLAIQSSTPTCICLFLMQTHTAHIWLNRNRVKDRPPHNKVFTQTSVDKTIHYEKCTPGNGQWYSQQNIQIKSRLANAYSGLKQENMNRFNHFFSSLAIRNLCYTF